MFTGIIEETGIIRSIRPASAGATVFIEAERIVADLKTGDSIAVNGACLTVTEPAGRIFSCDVSPETLHRTTLGRTGAGTTVNLERAMAIGDRLGGHIVQGHVDGVGQLVTAVPSGEGMVMEFSFPVELERYLVGKGSIAVDGISLTVASLRTRSFGVAVIPLTYRATNLRHLKPGDPVNLESDLLARYFERFFQLGLTANRTKGSGLTEDRLREQGY